MQIGRYSIYFWSAKLLTLPYRLRAKEDELSAIRLADDKFEEGIRTPPMTKESLKSRIDDLASPSLAAVAIGVPLFISTPLLIMLFGSSLATAIPYYLGLYLVGLTMMFAVRIGFAQSDYFRFKKWINDQRDPEKFPLSPHVYICWYDFILAALVAIGLGTLLPIL